MGDLTVQEDIAAELVLLVAKRKADGVPPSAIAEGFALACDRMDKLDEPRIGELIREALADNPGLPN